ncbi:MAG: oxidoreductase [bacterium]|nr:MAG: oxidoreductase [bacterium]
METTYRSIFKWGDKREEKLEKGIIALVKEQFGYTDDDFGKRYLSGDKEVKLNQKSRIPADIQQRFVEIAGSENVLSDDYSRASHAFGKFYGDLLYLRKGEIATPPDLVVSPRTEKEIEQILAICQQENIAITPVGGLSSVTRGVETPRGGISLDLTKHLNKILKVNTVNSTVRMEPGVYGPVLEKHLNDRGYTCGHFPQSFEYSTVGGWVAARGAGQASTGYGKIEDMVLALRVITPAGIIETKDFPATAEAWDLNKIFIGSEGTLGIITSVTLKIRKYRPENTAYASFVFKDFESATQSMRKIMQTGFGFPHLFRLSDPVETATAFKIKGFDDSLSDKFLKLKGYRSGERCLMFVSIEGDTDYTRLLKKKIKRIARKHGSFYIGSKPTKEWLKQRYESAYLRDPLMDVGIMTDTVETSVTWDNLLNLWTNVRNYLEHREKTHVMAHISHVYENGANLYFTFLSPMKQGDEMADYLQYHRGLIDAIHNNGGSLSHHHGIGRALAPWMEQEMGKTAMGLLQAVKDYLDPKGIMNPGNTLGLK